MIAVLTFFLSFCNVHVSAEAPTTAATPPPSSMTCPECGTFKTSGQLSCCGPGGTWFKKCGNAGDSKFDHTWSDGIEACTGKFISVGCGCVWLCTDTPTLTSSVPP